MPNFNVEVAGKRATGKAALTHRAIGLPGGIDFGRSHLSQVLASQSAENFDLNQF